MIYPTIDDFIATCARLKVLSTDKDEHQNERVPFVLRHEQLAIVKAILPATADKARTHNSQLAIAKPRQIGISTVMAALVAVLAVINSGITIGIAIHKEIYAKKLCNMVYDFLYQMGAPTHKNQLSIHVLHDATEGAPVDSPQNSLIQLFQATTSQSTEEISDLGRSYRFQFLWLSEVAYYPNATAVDTLEASAEGNTIVIESTPNGSDEYSKGRKFYDLYHSRRYKSLFFSVEDNPNYKDDPRNITDEEWDYAQQTYGFTCRATAAWWLDWTAGKDLNKAIRDYPIKEEHCWESRESPFMPLPRVIQPIKCYYPDVGGEIKRFIPADELGESLYVAGVDVALGRGHDSSAVAIMEMGTGRLVGSYKSNTVDINDFATVLADIYEHFYITEFVIENNNMGKSCCEAAEELGLPVERWQTNRTPIAEMAKLRRLIEEGLFKGDEDLYHECRSLTMDKHRRFKGKKDLLMAASFVVNRVLSFPLDPDTKSRLLSTHNKPEKAEEDRELTANQEHIQRLLRQYHSQFR